jgi:hypothetical protein
MREKEKKNTPGNLAMLVAVVVVAVVASGGVNLTPHLVPLPRKKKSVLSTCEKEKKNILVVVVRSLWLRSSWLGGGSHGGLHWVVVVAVIVIGRAVVTVGEWL